MPDVIIISTGDELLYGTTINTNSSFISTLFFGSNFKVVKHITVVDEINSIASAISESLARADVVITTGGLGPTDDDNTVEAVCRVSGSTVVMDDESEKKRSDYFQSMKFTPNSLDSKMSTVPADSFVISNRSGLAPGFIVSIGGKIIISLPGVPSEADDMMLQDVLPYLEKNYSFRDDMKLSYKMSGIRESDLNTMVNEIDLPDFLKVGITVKSGICNLIITGINEDLIEKENIDSLIRKKFSKYIFDYEAQSPEQELVFLLKEKRLTISTAESCTGGLIAKRITDIAGSSDVYKGSIIAYSNDIKKNYLDIPDETLKIYGAVSEITAGEMAASIKKKFNTDISISTTGIAGPGGGSQMKPVGTVCFGFQINETLKTSTVIIKGNRERVRTFASLYAINYVRDFLKNS